MCECVRARACVCVCVYGMAATLGREHTLREDCTLQVGLRVYTVEETMNEVQDDSVVRNWAIVGYSSLSCSRSTVPHRI